MEVALTETGKSAHAYDSTVIKGGYAGGDGGVDKPGLAAVEQHGEYHCGLEGAFEFRLRPARSQVVPESSEGFVSSVDSRVDRVPTASV